MGVGWKVAKDEKEEEERARRRKRKMEMRNRKRRRWKTRWRKDRGIQRRDHSPKDGMETLQAEMPLQVQIEVC